MSRGRYLELHAGLSDIMNLFRNDLDNAVTMKSYKENTRQLQLCSMPASPASRLHSLSPPCPPHQCGELVQVDGLDGVVVEARLA